MHGPIRIKLINVRIMKFSTLKFELSLKNMPLPSPFRSLSAEVLIAFQTYYALQYKWCKKYLIGV